MGRLTTVSHQLIEEKAQNKLLTLQTFSSDNSIWLENGDLNKWIRKMDDAYYRHTNALSQFLTLCGLRIQKPVDNYKKKIKYKQWCQKIL